MTRKEYLKLPLIAALAAASLCAATITVPNNSFENDAPGFGNPSGWTLFSSTASPTFTDNSRIVANDGSVYPIVSGVTGLQFVAVNLDHNYLSSGYPTPVVPPDGSLDGLVSDSLGVFARATIYTLTADIGISQSLASLEVGIALGAGAPSLDDVLAGDPSGFASLLVNTSELSSAALQTVSLTLNTNQLSALVGQPINASLIFRSEYEYGRQALFDNVSLTSQSAAPEPSSAESLGLAGLLALIGRLIRLRRARVIG